MLKGFRIIFIAVMCCSVFLCLSLQAEIVPLNKLDEASLQERASQDLHSVQVYRSGLKPIMNSLSQPGFSFLQKGSPNKMLSGEEKEALRSAWKSFLDYFLALDSIGRYYSQFNEFEGKEKQKNSF